MSTFVEECRREWKRLGVPDAIANEMAADLAADLAEAEADGSSPEDVLGTSAFDPRSFAASWAAERGVIPPSPPAERSSRRSPLLAATVAALAIAAIAAGVAILSSGPREVRMALPAPLGGGAFSPFVPSPRAALPRIKRLRGAAVGGTVFHVLPPLRIRPAFAVMHATGANLRPLGWLLVLLGGAGIVLCLAYWSPWAGPRTWPRRA